MIAAIFQTSNMMPITIAENIAVCDKSEIDMVKLEEAVRLAGFEEKIASLTEGLNTPINKAVHANGIELSGGEQQRLLPARAVYKDARLLVLDEPTSALDPIAESEMYQSYSEISRNKTSIFISHRLASTRFCDRIILLDGKQIAEQGTHDTLVAAGGKCAEMFEIQSQYYNQDEKEGA